MLNMKFKETIKSKSYSKGDLLPKRMCAEEVTATQSKIGNRDYVNEIFAGLMWLG